MKKIEKCLISKQLAINLDIDSSFDGIHYKVEINGFKYELKFNHEALLWFNGEPYGEKERIIIKSLMERGCFIKPSEVPISIYYINDLLTYSGGNKLKINL